MLLSSRGRDFAQNFEPDLSRGVPPPLSQLFDILKIHPKSGKSCFFIEKTAPARQRRHRTDKLVSKNDCFWIRIVKSRFCDHQHGQNFARNPMECLPEAKSAPKINEKNKTNSNICATRSTTLGWLLCGWNSPHPRNGQTMGVGTFFCWDLDLRI